MYFCLYYVIAKAPLYNFPLPLRIMFTTESSQYGTVLTPIANPYQIICPPLEQNILGHSTRPFRVRPPSKSSVVGNFRLPQDTSAFSIINNFSPERSSPEIEKRRSPDTDYGYSARAKSTSPTDSDPKSESSCSPPLQTTSDSSYSQIALVGQPDIIEVHSGKGGMAESGFNPLGCTLYTQDAGSNREDEVKSENELTFWENCTVSGVTETSPTLAQDSGSNSSSPSRLPPTPIQGEPGVVGGLQNKIKPIVNGIGRGAIGRGLKSKKRLNSVGEHNVGTLETAPIGWGELPMNPKDNFDDGTEFWGQPEKPILKQDNDMLMYLKTPYSSFTPYEMNPNTKHSAQYTSLTDQQKHILQEIMQSNFDFPPSQSDDSMGMGTVSPAQAYSHNSMNPMYQRHFSESNIQGPSMLIMQRNVITLLMKQQYLQMQKGFTLEHAIQYLLQETKAQHQKLMSTLYQQGSKHQYSPQTNLNIQISTMLINLLQQQLSNVTAQPMNGFPMGNQYLNKSMYIPPISDPHTPSYEPHYPSTPQEYQMGYPPSQTPRQGQAKNQQWIVQQLVKFHMFNTDNENKNEGKSVGKEPISLNYTKSLDPSFHAHDTSSMKYNLIRSSSLIDQQMSDYTRQRKMNSSLSSLHTDESYNFQELPASLYDAFEDKLVDPEEPVLHESYERVPPSPSYATQTHTFSPGALAFYPPGHFHDSEDKVSNLFSSLPANLQPATYEPPSPRLFYSNKLEGTPLDYEAFSHPDIYPAKHNLEVDKLSSRIQNKSPTQYNPLLLPGSSAKAYTPGYMPSYMVDGGNSNAMGMKGDLLTHSLPTGIGLERSDAAWLFLTGLNNRIDKAQLERYFSSFGSTSVVHSAKNRTAILTFKQANDARNAKSALKNILSPEVFESCDVCTDPNELSFFIGKFAESPRSPAPAPTRDTTPWGYDLSCSVDSAFSFDTSNSFPNTDFTQDDLSQLEEQIELNYLPNGLL